MGVDISGLNPVINTERPAYVDYDKLSEHERKAYWIEIEKWRDENPGEYFCSNWWGWRPIHALCEVVQEKYKLRINTSKWGENSGAGLRNPKKCNELADALEKHLDEHLADNVKEDDDRIYLCLGAWVFSDGSFLKDDIEEKLNNDYPYGSVLFNKVVLPDGSFVEPAHSSSLSHIKNWIAFLRNCGGFEIY